MTLCRRNTPRRQLIQRAEDFRRSHFSQAKVTLATARDTSAPPTRAGGRSAASMGLESRQEVRAGLEAHLARLWRYGLVLSGVRDAAEDLVQATCVRALERADRLQAGARLNHWQGQNELPKLIKGVKFRDGIEVAPETKFAA